MKKRRQKQASSRGLASYCSLLLGMVAGVFAFVGDFKPDAPTGHGGAAQTPPASKVQALNAAGSAENARSFSWAALFERRTVNFNNFPLQPVQAKAEQVAARLQAHLEDPIYVVQVSRKELSPLLAVTSAKGMCIVVLNTNPEGWAVWTRFIRDLPQAQRMDMVEVAVAHEIGHCMEVQNARTGDAQGTADSISALSGKTELYADLFAGAYARLHMGEKALVPVERLISMRQNFADAEPSHDTASMLARIWAKLGRTQPTDETGNNPHRMVMQVFR